MAGVVRSDLKTIKKIDFDSLSEKSLEQAVKDASQGNALLLNRGITDHFIEETLKIDGLFSTHFSNLSNLHLNFESYSTLTDSSIALISEKCPHIKKINLKSCSKISDRGVEELAKNCQELEEIDLSWCNISEKSLFSLAKYSKKLRRVGVRSCYITDGSIEELSKSCKDMKVFSLAWCKRLTDASLRSISSHFHQLDIFDIRGNERLSFEGFISFFNSVKNLKTVHLKRCSSVTDEVIESLVSNSGNIEKINLRGAYKKNSLSRRAILKIAEFSKDLRSLDCAWHDYLKDEELIELAKNCTKLESIDLSGCYQLTSKSLIALKNNCKNLKTVILFNNPNICETAIFK